MHLAAINEIIISMHTPYKIGILGATGMVGQRFIQLLENHPWFQVTWLAASDRSSGKRYEDAVRWKLDTPIPASVAKLAVSPATPEQNPDGVPEIIFAALDTDIARELEPKFAAAGCAVISNSSAFRMQADVPLVIPEVNADHLALIPQQNWNGSSNGGQKRGYIVTNPNCSAIGLVMALKPLAERFGLRSVFVSTMQPAVQDIRECHRSMFWATSFHISRMKKRSWKRRRAGC